MKENPMATRSKYSLAQALLELMQEMPYREISIRMLTERAGLSRQAFYTNFSDMDSVLISHMLGLLEDILQKIQIEQINTMEKLASMYADIVVANATLFRVLVENELTGLVVRVYSQHLDELPSVLASQRDHRTETEKKYCDAFWVAGFVQIFAAWISGNMKTDKAEIVSIICDIMQGNYFPPRGGS